MSRAWWELLGAATVVALALAVPAAAAPAPPQTHVPHVAPAACAERDLTISMSRAAGASERVMQGEAITVVLTNHGARACELRGFLEVHLRNTKTNTNVAFTTVDTSETSVGHFAVSRVEIPPGGHAKVFVTYGLRTTTARSVSCANAILVRSSSSQPWLTTRLLSPICPASYPSHDVDITPVEPNSASLT